MPEENLLDSLEWYGPSTIPFTLVRTSTSTVKRKAGFVDTIS
jgi:hypothetical protein